MRHVYDRTALTPEEAERVVLEHAQYRRDVTRLVRWLACRPEWVQVFNQLIETETGWGITAAQHDWADCYLQLGVIGWCNGCHASVVMWPDEKLNDWPSMELHRCPALQLENRMEGAFAE